MPRSSWGNTVKHLGLNYGVAALALGACAAASTDGLTVEQREIRDTVSQLADRMQAAYVFPDVARQYAEHLRTRRDAGAFDNLFDPHALAEALQNEMNGVHRDAHLRVTVNTADPGDAAPRWGPPPADQAFRDARWLAQGVAYLRIAGLPGDDAAVERMAILLDQYANARILILDARACPGGSLEAMDVLFSRLYAQPTRLLNMDIRSGANPELEVEFATTPDVLRHEQAPQGITRFVHWASPTTPASDLADARVYVLTDYTASACEHLALALKHTGRATLVGATTRGAGHFGGEQDFGGGRFQVWLPVGRTYVAETGQDWEGVGVAPHREVAPADALTVVLADLGVAQSAASAEVAQSAPRLAVRRIEPPPGRPSYGIAISPPRTGDDSIPILEIIPNRPASAAGLQAGDRIIRVNNTPVERLEPGQFESAMRASPLTLTIERDAEELTFTLRLGD